MSAARSFRFCGREGRAYRVYVNTQTGYWFASYNTGQGRQRVTLRASTKAEAEAAVRTLDAPPAPKPETEPLNWTDFQQRYLDYKTEQGKAPRTVLRYKAALDAFGRHLKGEGVQTVSEVTLPVLESYARYRTGQEDCGPKTAYNDALTIKNALKWGSKSSRGLLRANPALDWETKEPVTPKRKCYTLGEVGKLETGVRNWLKRVVTTLAWAGLRIGELVNLRWSDVDFEQRVLHVRVQETWKPKGRYDRTVPMNPKVEAALRHQGMGAYVFLGPNGGRIKESYALECLKADQHKLGMAVGDLHGFRRFFATTMLSLGVNIHTVMQWGGWRSLETLLRYLADVEVKDSVTAMDEATKRLALPETGKILAISGGVKGNTDVSSVGKTG